MLGVHMDIGEALVNAYPKMLRFSKSWVRDTAQAEDFAMQACEKILSRPDANELQNVEAYAITVIKNLIKDYAKKEKPIYGDPPDLPDETQIGAVLDIRDALSRLSEGCQKILELFGLGNSYEEIGNTLGVPLGTVQSRMSRCRTQFKAEWDQDDE
jgi:RNA polymerase sigma-70 factor (ECF subfamily)